MVQFALTNILLLSVGSVLYIFVRALPRVEEEVSAEKRGLLERWIASEIPEKIDAAIENFLFKFLRKTRVVLLKADNSVSVKLQKMKPEGNGKAPAIDFKEIAGKSGGEA